MKRYGLTLLTMFMLQIPDAGAGLFDQGIGGAMYYGPYTGGHGYSYNTAYGYGFCFSAADTWQRDPLAYPAGIYPYRPYGWPISYRVFPTPPAPYVSVPGPNGLPILEPTVPPVTMITGVPVLVAPGAPGAPGASGVPSATGAQQLKTAPMEELSATVRVKVPAGAEVWFDKEKTTQTGTDRVFQSAPLTPGKTHVCSVRAKWNEGGQAVEQFRVVGVRAGETAKLTFSSARP
jgi:uncharacterized protein (TIGR03000 family)